MMQKIGRFYNYCLIVSRLFNWKGFKKGKSSLALVREGMKELQLQGQK